MRRREAAAGAGTAHDGRSGHIQLKRAQEVRVPVGKGLVDLFLLDLYAVKVYRLFKGTYGFQA